MTTKAPLPPARRNPKGLPPVKNITKNNLLKPEPQEIVALNFRVASEFKKDFKIAAANYGITQSELLKQTFNEWQKSYS